MPDAGDFARGQKRLIANPFLAILGWILAAFVMGNGLQTRDPLLSLTALLGMLASTSLIQYHCLDCGKTGWAFRAGRHLCPLAAARGSTVGAGRSWCPRLASQLKVWFAIIITAAFYYLLSAASHR